MKPKNKRIRKILSFKNDSSVLYKTYSKQLPKARSYTSYRKSSFIV
jgi:hypothetical protein